MTTVTVDIYREDHYHWDSEPLLVSLVYYPADELYRDSASANTFIKVDTVEDIPTKTFTSLAAGFAYMDALKSGEIIDTLNGITQLTDTYVSGDVVKIAYPVNMGLSTKQDHSDRLDAFCTLSIGNNQMVRTDGSGDLVANSVTDFKTFLSITADDCSDGSTNKVYTSTEKTKLSGIATGATANDTDANLKARANHTGTQTASTISDFNTAADARITAQKASASGIATLDSGGKIPTTQLPNSVMEYQGTWNASTNAPSLVDGTGNAGDVYKITVSGTRNLGSGSIAFTAGDLLMYNGSVWQQSPDNAAVSSVFGRTGAVIAATNDYNTDQVSEGSTNKYYTDERAQDGVAAMMTPGSGMTGTYNDGANTYTFAAPRTTSTLSLSLVGSGATGTQISSTKDSTVRCTVSTSTTSTIGGPSTSVVVLKICSTNNSTEGSWTTVATFESDQTITLAVALQSIQIVKGQLCADVPAGWYVKLVNSGSGTHSEAFVSGQQTIYG